VLTQLDWAIVEWIARVGAAGARDVQVAMRLSRTHAYRRLARCVEYEVLSPLRLLHGQPSLYPVDARGASVDRPRRVAGDPDRRRRVCAPDRRRAAGGGV
jgi:hypothetical protein